MIRALLAFLERILFVPPPLARDMDGKYVSRAGRAYRVTVEPQPGVADVVIVTLYGDPCVPHTFLNHLCVRVPPRAPAIDGAIRELLAAADAAEARFAALKARYVWPATTTRSPEEQVAIEIEGRDVASETLAGVRAAIGEAFDDDEPEPEDREE